MGMYTERVRRVETESGTIYQFTDVTWANGEKRPTFMSRLPGRNSKISRLDFEQITVTRMGLIAAGRPLSLTVLDPWGGQKTTLLTTPVVRVTEWLNS